MECVAVKGLSLSQEMHRDPLGVQGQNSKLGARAVDEAVDEKEIFRLLRSQCVPSLSLG